MHHCKVSRPFLSEYAGPAERSGLERGGLEDSLGCSSWRVRTGLQGVDWGWGIDASLSGSGKKMLYAQN